MSAVRKQCRQDQSLQHQLIPQAGQTSEYMMDKSRHKRRLFSDGSVQLCVRLGVTASCTWRRPPHYTCAPPHGTCTLSANCNHYPRQASEAHANKQRTGFCCEDMMSSMIEVNAKTSSAASASSGSYLRQSHASAM